jgi:cell division protein FtsZ
MNFKVLSEMAKPEEPVSIVVIGAGGGGSNAVNGMIECGIRGVKFIALNTDIQALRANNAEVKLQIGSKITGGRGAGGDPEIGERAAHEDKEQIAKAIEGADMVFITVGMGGGTGTGAAPIIAEIAKSQNALTVGVVTKPFDSELSHRMEIAEKGIIKLRKVVDSLIVIPNQRLLNNVDRKTSMLEAFHKADDILRQGLESILDCIVKTGFINIDFADAISVMKDQGDALMAIGYGAGENRIEDAVSGVLDNPLLEDTSIKGATRALIYVAANEDLPAVEYDDVVKRITADMDKDATIKAGLYFDKSMGDKIRVTVIATGFNGEMKYRNLESAKPKSQKDTISEREFSAFIGDRSVTDFLPPRDMRDDFKYSSEDLDVPTVIRDRKVLAFSSEAI